MRRARTATRPTDAGTLAEDLPACEYVHRILTLRRRMPLACAGTCKPCSCRGCTHACYAAAVGPPCPRRVPASRHGSVCLARIAQQCAEQRGTLQPIPLAAARDARLRREHLRARSHDTNTQPLRLQAAVMPSPARTQLPLRRGRETASCPCHTEAVRIFRIIFIIFRIIVVIFIYLLFSHFFSAPACV